MIISFNTICIVTKYKNMVCTYVPVILHEFDEILARGPGNYVLIGSKAVFLGAEASVWRYFSLDSWRRGNFQLHRLKLV